MTGPEWAGLLPPDARWWRWPDETRSECGCDEPGPWGDEPDKVSWTDPASGRPCLIVRSPMGGLCGYAAVDPGHPWHGVSCWDLPEEPAVHGGLTYSDVCDDSPDAETQGICHVPAAGAPERVWWFGFDCGHSCDVLPRMLRAMRESRLVYPAAEVYRDVPYVVGEVQRLATQLVAAEVP